MRTRSISRSTLIPSTQLLPLLPVRCCRLLVNAFELGSLTLLLQALLRLAAGRLASCALSFVDSRASKSWLLTSSRWLLRTTPTQSSPPWPLQTLCTRSSACGPRPVRSRCEGLSRTRCSRRQYMSTSTQVQVRAGRAEMLRRDARKAISQARKDYMVNICRL